MNTETQYKIETLLGAGSFGNVYQCYDSLNKRRVALKCPKNYGPSDEMEFKFLNRVLSQGYDPDEVRIVRILDLVRIRGTPCIVMECLEENLETTFQDVELQVRTVRSIGVQLLKAISCLRSLGIVHGDIKPSNILVSGDEDTLGVKLADLGGFEVSSMRPPRVHQILTTRPYRSPEVLVGLPASFPVDMWAVALVLVECFAGQKLFAASSTMNLMHAIVHLLGTDECFLQGEFVEDYFVDEQLTLKELDEPEDEMFSSLLEFFEPLMEDCTQAEIWDAMQFLQFVHAALALDSSRRITPEEGLNNLFFTMGHLTEHTEYTILGQSHNMGAASSGAWRLFSISNGVEQAKKRNTSMALYLKVLGIKAWCVVNFSGFPLYLVKRGKQGNRDLTLKSEIA